MNGALRESRNVLPVSVVIPCYCCADTIKRAVVSIVSQTMLPAEVWLVDDASPDEGKTLEVLYALRDRYEDTAYFEVISLAANGGPSVARNAAWDRATQPFLAFLDADDAWHPKKLEIQYGWMALNPSVAITGHSIARLDDARDFNISSAPGLPDAQPAWQVSPRRLLCMNYFPTRSVMLRRDLPYRFDPTKRRSEDYLLWLLILFAGYPAWRLELPLAWTFKAPYGESGLTGDLWEMEKGELDTYKRVYQLGHINAGVWCALLFYSFLKFGRRWLNCRLTGR